MYALMCLLSGTHCTNPLILRSRTNRRGHAHWICQNKKINSNFEKQATPRSWNLHCCWQFISIVSAATTLTAFHFTVTALVGYISALSSNAPYKTLPFWDLFWFSLIANSSIVCMNLSLMLNSVGFYQVCFDYIKFYEFGTYLCH